MVFITIVSILIRQYKLYSTLIYPLALSYPQGSQRNIKILPTSQAWKPRCEGVSNPHKAEQIMTINLIGCTVGEPGPERLIDDEAQLRRDRLNLYKASKLRTEEVCWVGWNKSLR